MEKYKHHKSPGWFIYFDEFGKEYPAFTEKNMPGMYRDMEEWKKIPGNEIEPAETEDEKTARLADEKKQALLDQEKELLNLIINNQYHLTTKRKAFIPDIPTWDLKLDKWDDQLDLVRDQIKLMNEGKEYALIDIEPVPTF